MSQEITAFTATAAITGAPTARKPRMMSETPTFGFRQSNPSWGVDALLASMRSIQFGVQGFNRTYWDLFVGAGFNVSVFLLFAAVLAWQLGGLPAETLARMRVIVWAFALCFAAITVLSWIYFFALPIAFLSLITLCLIAAAWRSAKPA